MTKVWAHCGGRPRSRSYRKALASFRLNRPVCTPLTSYMRAQSGSRHSSTCFPRPSAKSAESSPSVIASGFSASGPSSRILAAHLAAVALLQPSERARSNSPPLQQLLHDFLLRGHRGLHSADEDASMAFSSAERLFDCQLGIVSVERRYHFCRTVVLIAFSTHLSVMSLG